MATILYNIIISPIELVVEVVFELMWRLVGQHQTNQGLAVIGVSVAISLLTLPLYRRADTVQQKERDLQKSLSYWVNHIKKSFKGDERYMMLQAYYRQNGYSPIMALNGAVSLLLEIPFFMAAYHFLSHLEALKGASFGLITDMGTPDGLIRIGSFSLNLLPVFMTAINCLSAAIYLKGFPLKDKIQTYGMALIFLVLLYNSPSGLVVYWTCNNIFSLVKNVFYKMKNPKKCLWILSCVLFASLMVFAFFNNPNAFGWKKRVLFVFGMIFFLFPTCMKFFTYSDILRKFCFTKNKVINSKLNFSTIIYCALLPLVVFIITPLEIYLANKSEFTMKFVDIYGTLAIITGCFSLFNLFLYFLLPSKLKSKFIVFLISIFIGIFIQAYLLPNNLGVLDGSKILLSNHVGKLAVSTLFWLLIMFVLQILYFKINRQLFKKTIHSLVLIVFVGQLLILVRAKNAVNTFSVDIDAIENVKLSKADEWSVSRNRNVIVFLLDAFRASLFEELLNDTNLNLTEDFEDFTFYPDTISQANRTVYSVPAIFSGKVNEKQLSFGAYIRDVFPDSPFGKEISSEKYNVSIFTNENYIDRTGSTKINNLTNSIKNNFTASTKIKLAKKMIQLGLFKLMPVFLKNHFWIATSDFQQLISKDSTTYSFDDVLFYNELCKNDLAPIYSNTCFRFFHLDGAHVPYTMNENCERVNDGESDMKRQAIGSLRIVKKYVDSLKRLGLYEKATIFIIADHGWEPMMNEHVNPIFLFKESGVNKEFSISDSYISFFDLHTMFVKALKGEKVDIEKNFVRSKDEPRYFYYHSYDVGRDSNTIYEYEVNGSIKNIHNIRETGNSLFYGVRKSDGKYKLNTKLYFTTEGTANPYCDDGFDRNELSGTWTQKDTACMEFNIGKINSDLTLELDFNVFEYGQKSFIYANNHFVTELKEDGGPVYIAIPKEYLDNDTGKLEIKFELPDAKEYGNRRLTYFMHYLVIYRKDN